MTTNDKITESTKTTCKTWNVWKKHTIIAIEQETASYELEIELSLFMPNCLPMAFVINYNMW